MQFLSAMPFICNAVYNTISYSDCKYNMHFKTHILASLFLKFLDTFHAERSTSQNKSFKHLPIQQIINFSLYAKIRLFCIGAAHTASHRQKKTAWLRLHARTVYASKFYCACLIQIICRIFAPSPTLRSTEWRALQLAPAAAALFPFFRLMIQPAPFITFRIPLFPNYMPFCSCMQTMVAHRRID